MVLKSWSKKQPADAKYSEIESETNNHRLLVGVETNLIKKNCYAKNAFLYVYPIHFIGRYLNKFNCNVRSKY